MLGGDPFRKALPNTPLVVPAVIYNKLLELLKREAQHRHEDPRDQAAWSKLHRQAGVILIKNDSGTDQERFAVLGLDVAAAAINPTTDEGKDRSILIGKTPDTSKHLGRFVVLVEPIAQGNIGKAVVCGFTIVRLSVGKEWHDRADVVNNDTSKLASNTSGAATILWKEETGTTRWALIKLCNRYEEEFPAKITKRTAVLGPADAWMNRWKYTFLEQELVIGGYDGWQDKFNGRTGDAYNGIENPNDGKGEEGCGIVVDDELRLLPVGIGANVLMTEVRYGNGATALKDYWFRFENDAGEGSSSSSGSGGGPLPGMGNNRSKDIRSLASRQCVNDGECQWEVYVFETWRHEPRKKPKRVKVEIETGCKTPICGAPSEPPDPGSMGSSPPLLDRWRPCSATDDSEDIFLPTWVFNVVSVDRDFPTIQLNGEGTCYQFEEADVAGQTETAFEHLEVYEECDAPGCPQPCPECVRIQTEDGGLWVELGRGENDNSYLPVLAASGLTVTGAGLYYGADGHWYIVNLHSGTWSAAYKGPKVACPHGETFVLSTTIAGSPPATIAVVFCEDFGGGPEECDCLTLGTILVDDDTVVLDYDDPPCEGGYHGSGSTWTLEDSGLYHDGTRWMIDSLTDGTNAGRYQGPQTACPWGAEFVLVHTYSGSPPAAVTTVQNP